MAKVCLFVGELISKLIEKTMRKKIALLKTCGMQKKFIYINRKKIKKIRQ